MKFFIFFCNFPFLRSSFYFFFNIFHFSKFSCFPKISFLSSFSFCQFHSEVFIFLIIFSKIDIFLENCHYFNILMFVFLKFSFPQITPQKYILTVKYFTCKVIKNLKLLEIVKNFKILKNLLHFKFIKCLIF